MFDLSAYALRFLEYLVLMVLFGVPLFGWYGSRRSALADALPGWPFVGVLLVSADRREPYQPNSGTPKSTMRTRYSRNLSA